MISYTEQQKNHKLTEFIKSESEKFFSEPYYPEGESNE